ncbi:MAG: hypothetical protein ABSD52_06265 [Candidatus Cybelea sp.]|jgi:hypothetical protein
MPAAPSAAPIVGVKRQSAGLGPVVESKFGGEIFGWDIDQNGNDGVLTETIVQQSGMDLNAIETFDLSSGQITKVVQKRIQPNSTEPVVRAIAGSDVGIIDVEHDPGLQRNDTFDLISPVSGNKITGHSKTPHPVNIVPNFMTNNQASSSQVMFAAFDNHGSDQPVMFTYDTAMNKWGQRREFSRKDLFNTNFHVYAAIDPTTNEAVTGYLKRTRYNPHESPTIYIMDAATGKHLRSFYGVGYGFPNGMAIDPTTDTMCTTTTGDMDVEFYNLSSGKGKAVQIPVLFGGGAETNGAAVAADPIHHLFLVAQLNSTFSSTGGSTVIVYDERGKLVEFINGFNFLELDSVVIPHLAVVPSKRIGYVDGPNSNELQEFTY